MTDDPVEYEKTWNRKYHELFTTPLGKEVLDELRDGFLDVVPFTPAMQTVDVSKVLLFEGGRTVVAYILDRIAAHETPPTASKRDNQGYA